MRSILCRHRAMLRSLFISFCKLERYGDATRRAGPQALGRFLRDHQSSGRAQPRWRSRAVHAASEEVSMTASLERVRIEREKEQDAGDTVPSAGAVRLICRRGSRGGTGQRGGVHILALPMWLAREGQSKSTQQGAHRLAPRPDKASWSWASIAGAAIKPTSCGSGKMRAHAAQALRSRTASPGSRSRRFASPASRYQVCQRR